MSTETSVRRIWPGPTAVISSIGIFAATFFACAERQRLHQDGSYAPAGIGIAAFVIVMLGLTAAMLPKERRTVWLVAGFVAAETTVFSYAIMFLLLNIYGS